ncbi:hypothetical protein FDG2_2995 [Candidatus Protofrankia californiensis]|uniref:VapC45 PIN like domain-containing protein n=1 Tax=Candidatus Protofrankia californiensis TaxID=1839754 RepID=A0A1C3NYR0_9ACTN|nr:hypothetical protein FDG2_2995 [Candidatus Protofrankia californiensis]
MAADPSQLRFYADESALGIGRTLEVARRDVVHPGHKFMPECPLGSLDTEWIPRVAVRGLIVISRDRRIRTKPAELALLREHRLRVLWIAGKKDLSTWDTLARLVRRWDDIENEIARRRTGPWFLAVQEKSLVELDV